MVRHGVRFVWDAEKASGNVMKHGVRFDEAVEVFFDPFVRVREADAGGERRDAAIGLTEDWRMLFVVHLERDGDVLRIIAARLATG